MGIKKSKSSKAVAGGKVIAAGSVKQPKTTKKISVPTFKPKHDPNVVG